MNRRDIVQTIAACDALAKALRAALKADASAEYTEQGTAPTWRMPGFTVSSSITHDAVQVVDEQAWRTYVELAYPHQIYTAIRVREAWQDGFLKAAAPRGDPPQDVDGTVMPGLAFWPGGEFKSVTVLPTSETKATLGRIADAIVAGELPPGLPALEAGDAAQ